MLKSDDYLDGRQSQREIYIHIYSGIKTIKGHNKRLLQQHYTIQHRLHQEQHLDRKANHQNKIL